ncbi:MAG: 50S ribosomal protein L25 [Armatimonadetes bacterium]|nr:50S ribosomal protein L25 [Armatimonadota bacterium]MBI2972404.1 50S ribosomal protein L25 [Armatimonadota bacterium]
MERVSLEAKRRDGTGTSKVRKLRLQGLVPAVVYGRGREPVPVAVDGKSLRASLHTHAGLNVLIDLSIADGSRSTETVMVREVQRGMFRREIIHVDFHTIDLTETLEAHVRLVFTGQAKGVVDDGGVLEIHLREVVVECLPAQIPESIEIDISALGVGDSLHASDIKMPAEVTMVTSAEEAIATVVMPKEIEEVAPAAAAVPEAAAEAAAPEAAAPAEGKPAEKAGEPEKPEKPERPEKKEKG